MGDRLANPRVQFALAGVVLIVVGIVIGVVISSSREVAALGDRILISTGSASEVAEDLPLTAAEAKATGWTDLVRCFRGRGKYFEKMKPTGTSPSTYDRTSASRLWEVSENLTGISGENRIDIQ